MSDPKTTPYFRVCRTEQMRVLASAARQEIVDTVQTLGGACTAAELARELGRPADGLYYHLRVLVEAGLLVSTDNSGPRGEARYAIPGAYTSMRLAYDTADPEQAAAVKDTATTVLRVAARDFAAAVVPGTVTDGPERELWAGRQKSWLSAAELREANALLERLNSLFNQPRSAERDRLFAFTYVLAPVAAGPVRRGMETD